MIVTDMNGYLLEECPATQANYERLKMKYGRNFYAFAATPTESYIGPLRKPGVSRKFTLSE